MSSQRFKALERISKRVNYTPNLSNSKISSFFGENVFDLPKMLEYLSKEGYNSVKKAIENGTRIDRKVADDIANGMKNWAISRGATHYSHWFQPLTDATAEKHDSFHEPIWGGGSVETFKGDLLVQQEPDASSFPNGGLRNTFEARGYTAWDPSSPAFIFDNTLCIPTVFIAYTGESLDYKAPLLKSLSSLDTIATQVCQYFDKDVNKTSVTLGWEQEYFLIDEDLFYSRPDLVQTGRTLMGHIAAKDQQLEDHYFGAIPERVTAFMKDFENESYKLAIPIKTRHNEVAPNQFECAPMFEEANIAVDHNILLMAVMRKVASRHKLKVLFHEKPFDGVNGSGKHCNWSLITNTGVNLLSPGSKPKTNMQFLTFLINIIKAIHSNGYMIMSSVASESNSHRLGANEAPPAIMSVFIGSTLSAILEDFKDRVTDKTLSSEEKSALKLDIGKIPEILLDNTDRNRTSPFAFTGNRFEFRATGSSANCSGSLIPINVAISNQLKQFKTEVDKRINSGEKKDDAIFKVLSGYITTSKDILFGGNGYSQEWRNEAASRGLRSINNVIEAFGSYLEPASLSLFVSEGVFTERELHARCEIKYETYLKKVQIESRVMGDLSENHIIPTAIRYQNILIQNIQGVKEIFPDQWQEIAKEEIRTVKRISKHIQLIRTNVLEMIAKRKECNLITSEYEKARAYSEKVYPYLSLIRRSTDKLEMIVDDEMWPLPKYREMLTIY